MEKKLKVLVATNLYQIDPVVYSGHLSMLHQLGKKKDEIEVIFFGPWRVPIDRARNDAAQFALYSECDYLFFFDDDMYFFDPSFPLSMIETMRKSNDTIHILQALAFIRGYPFQPMIFKYKQINEYKQLKPFNEYKEHIREDGLVEVDAVGCCATLIDCRVFKKVPSPWFVTGKTNTEDIYFCVKAKEYLEGLGIFCDTKIKIGHLLERPVLTEDNVEILRKFYEDNQLNQLLLKDETFVKSIKAASPEVHFEERINPLTFDNLPLRKEANDG